jgi:hypothetical protein
MKTRIGFALFKLVVVAPLELTSQPNNARATAPKKLSVADFASHSLYFVDYLDPAIGSRAGFESPPHCISRRQDRKPHKLAVDRSDCQWVRNRSDGN